MSQVTEQSVRFQTALASIKLIQASAVLDLTEDDFDFLTSNKVWIATDRSRARRCVEACVYGTLDFVGYPRFPAPVEFIAAVIAYYVHPVNIQTACLIMEGSLVLFLVLWLKLVKDFLKVRCRLALLPFLISCLIWLDLVASLPLIKERILVIILLLHFLSLMLGSVLVLMLPLLVWLTPDLRIKKSLLKCNWTIRKRLPRCKMRLKKRLLAFSRRLHARIRKTRYMHKMRCLLINRRSLLLALRLLWKTPIFPSNSRFPRL